MQLQLSAPVAYVDVDDMLDRHERNLRPSLPDFLGCWIEERRGLAVEFKNSSQPGDFKKGRKQLRYGRIHLQDEHGYRAIDAILVVPSRYERIARRAQYSWVRVVGNGAKLCPAGKSPRT